MHRGCYKADDQYGLDFGSLKIRVITHANTTLDCGGICMSAAEPHHRRSVDLARPWGLVWGIGDALIGVNPVKNTAEATKAILESSYH